MKNRAQMLSESEQRVPTIKELLEERLKFNEPVLDHLPDAFASLVSSTSTFSSFPVDPLPVLRHALRISDEACYLSGDTSSEVFFSYWSTFVCADLSLELSWYTCRGSLAAIYTAAGAVLISWLWLLRLTWSQSYTKWVHPRQQTSFLNICLPQARKQVKRSMT